jgi:hypothetical protein
VSSEIDADEKVEFDLDTFILPNKSVNDNVPKTEFASVCILSENC